MSSPSHTSIVSLPAENLPPPSFPSRSSNSTVIDRTRPVLDRPRTAGQTARRTASNAKNQPTFIDGKHLGRGPTIRGRMLPAAPPPSLGYQKIGNELPPASRFETRKEEKQSIRSSKGNGSANPGLPVRHRAKGKKKPVMIQSRTFDVPRPAWKRSPPKWKRAESPKTEDRVICC